MVALGEGGHGELPLHKQVRCGVYESSVVRFSLRAPLAGAASTGVRVAGFWNVGARYCRAHKAQKDTSE